MSIKRSLSFKLIIGFTVVIAPLVFFLFYNNFYASNIVRDKVAQSNSNLLFTQVRSIEKSLGDINKYLIKMAVRDPDINSLSLYAYDSGEYQLTQVRSINKLRNDLEIYNFVETFFTYSLKNDDLVVARGNYEDFQIYPKMIKQIKNTDSNNWEIINNKGKYELVRFIKVNSDIYIGASITISSLIDPLQGLDLGENGEALIINAEGIPLTNTSLSSITLSQLKAKIAALYKPYQTVFEASSGMKYMLVGKTFMWVNMSLVKVIPEKTMLKNLLFFQRMIYLIPLGAALILGLYLLILKNVLLAPIGVLIKGMRRVSQGDLDFRLKGNQSTELAFLTEIFNSMVFEIKHLKIDVYEEKIRVQKAEFKHLQMQINPHFYLNTLNIIYNFAALKNFTSVQKLSLHLADYFRFTMQTNHTSIPLSDEIRHIVNYLEIQKHRYPQHLSFEVLIPDEYKDYPVPALIIQPFVENAIIHGFFKRSESFHIQIEAKTREEQQEVFFEVQVVDNGKGFSPERLELLQSGAYKEESGDQHLGIWNVYHRLRMKYGDAADIFFENNVDQGAIVRIRLPLNIIENQGER